MDVKPGVTHKANSRPRGKLVFPTLIALLLIIGSHTVPGADAATTSTDDDGSIGNYLRTYRSSIVIVKGKSGAGSGFIFTRAGRQFLVSNIHVMAGIKSPTFTTLDRSPLKFKPNSAVTAVGHDIFMMELQGNTNGIPMVESFANTVTINDAIVVFGNSGGSDVATAVKGKVVGIGPDRVEISAEIERGNSGSPIIHVPTGQVIGVATYMTSETVISGEKKNRRFGYRLDTVKQWEAVDWARFYAEADKLEKVTASTLELKMAVAEIYQLTERTNKFRVYSYESPVIRTALDNFYTALRRAEKRQHVTVAADNLVSSLRGASQTYPTPTKPTFTYDYFRRTFIKDDSDRTEVIQMLATSLQK
jgi:hypothetical protein